MKVTRDKGTKIDFTLVPQSTAEHWHCWLTVPTSRGNLSLYIGVDDDLLRVEAYKPEEELEEPMAAFRVTTEGEEPL